MASKRTSPHVLTNRKAWNAIADDYQKLCASMKDDGALTWGWWRHKESDLQLLGNVSGKHVLDLGCGGAQWAVRLARCGARVVALDTSDRQLTHARRTVAGLDLGVTLVQGDAELLAFDDSCFDIVVSNWGAMSFTDPYRSVPQAARVLRSGGSLIICTWSPVFWLCTDEHTETPGAALKRRYFGLRRWAGPQGTTRFQLAYGDWIRLFRKTGMQVEDLVEPLPLDDVEIPDRFYQQQWRSWILSWPFDCIWKVRKE